jgi:phosphodiesterase/alkaline phosphatase D-like protein
MTMLRRFPALAFAALAAATLVGCDRGLPQDPAQGGAASITLDLTVAGGAAEAFDKADALWVRGSVENVVRFERTITISAGGRDVETPLEVLLSRASETVRFEIELRRGAAAIFRGATPAQLRVGRRRTVTVTLDAVVAGLRLPETLPDVESYGDAVSAQRALVFATGDTLEIGPVDDWASLDPTIIAIQGGVPIALTDGEARLVAREGTLSDTVRVRVFAVVRRVVIGPSDDELEVTASRRYTASLFDARNNPITGRVVSWTSSNPQVLQVDGAGNVTGVATGSANLTAASGAASAALQVQVLPAGPRIVTDQVTDVAPASATLHATVRPNGYPTQVVFEYSQHHDFLTFVTSATTQVAGTTGAVVVSRPITGLNAGIVYYVRARAQNAVGSMLGNVVQFTTGTTPGGGTLQATTVGATSIGLTQATVHGVVQPGGTPASWWFEYGTTPNPSGFTVTPSQQLAGGTIPISLSTLLTGLAPNTTYYFRIVASNATATARGAILTFTTLVDPSLDPPDVNTLPALSVDEDSGILSGIVNPNGSLTQAWFEWGTDANFNVFATTANQPIGAGTSAVIVTEPLQGLANNTTYYYRAVASNGGGTTFGDVLSFTTGSGGSAGPAPLATTLPAAPVAADNATLNGLVTPNGAATHAWFEWGTDPSLASFSITPLEPVGSGFGAVAVARTLTGLAPNTTYWYRVVGSSARGTARASILSFTTTPGGGGGGGPTVSTLPAGPVRADSAVVNGTVNPNGSATQAWFEWGTDPTLSTFAATAPFAVGAGTSVVTVAELVEPLTPGTTYYYRIAASNAGGTARGAILSFVASTVVPPVTPPSATTLPATGVAGTSATINGSAGPNGSPTVVWFEWGTSATLSTFTRTTLVAIGAGGAVDVSRLLTGLTRDTRYYFRVVAFNAGGSAAGAILEFTTLEGT